MRILYVGMKYDYGRPEQGLSFEHCNLFDTLHRMGHEMLVFDFMTLLARHGRRAMNRRLLEVVRAEAPDLLFAVLFKNELSKRVMRRISTDTGTVTMNWFCDDHWRFERFSRRWAPCFNWSITTAAEAVPKYHAAGVANVIRSQWACNHFAYRRLDMVPDIDVSFVGQPHGNRRDIVGCLRAAGIAVQTWGNGWEAGRVDQRRMIEIFNASRINLNLAGASAAIDTSTPAGWLEHRWRKWTGRLGLRRPDRPADLPPGQIKGRNFEVPGCGGFLLTEAVAGLDEYYRMPAEVVATNNVDDLVATVRYYLEHEGQRRAVADAGYRRTLGEHTYVHRFADIFRAASLPVDAPGIAAALAGNAAAPAVEEVT